MTNYFYKFYQTSVSTNLSFVALGLLIITALSMVFLSSTKASGTSTTANAAVTVSSACTMTGTLNTPHTATVNPGVYQDSTGKTTFSVICNDPNGFAIYAIGYTGEEYSGTNHTRLVGPNSNTITTGTATSGSTSNWAMKLTSDDDETINMNIVNGYNNYSAIPDTYTKVAQITSSTASATPATMSSTYAAFIASDQTAGTYNGKVKYTMVHPYTEEPLQPVACVAGGICYQPNASGVTGQMGNQSASDNAEVVLWASNFKRAGYGFAGWNTEFDYSGTYYGPNQTITAPSDVSTNGLSLYAVWIKSAGTLQNWSGCSSLTQGSVTALTDERGSDTYAVAKLADGKCWMIENLRLDDSPELSSANTHNPSLPLTNVYDTGSTSNHLSPTTDPTQTAWCTANSSACDDQSMLATNNTTLFTNNTASSYSASSNVYSYGNYYNWYSATAGHGKYGSDYGSSFTSPGDICPAGWHLPTGKDASGEFGLLDIALGGTGASSSSSTTPTGTDMSKAWRTYPNNFVYSGYVNGSSVNIRGSYGNYWSASGNASYSAYNLYFISTGVHPGTGGGSKYYGGMVRCLSGS